MPWVILIIIPRRIGNMECKNVTLPFPDLPNFLWPAKTRPIYRVYTPGREAVHRWHVHLISVDVTLFMPEGDVDVALISNVYCFCVCSVHRKLTGRYHALSSLEAKVIGRHVHPYIDITMSNNIVCFQTIWLRFWQMHNPCLLILTCLIRAVFFPLTFFLFLYKIFRQISSLFFFFHSNVLGCWIFIT